MRKLVNFYLTPLIVICVFSSLSKAEVNPLVTMSPQSGTVGTTFTNKGSGFTPNSRVIIYRRLAPGGIGEAIGQVETDSRGSFSLPWTAKEPRNNAAWWAVDVATERKSKEVEYSVLPAEQPLAEREQLLKDLERAKKIQKRLEPYLEGKYEIKATGVGAAVWASDMVLGIFKTIWINPERIIASGMNDETLAFLLAREMIKTNTSFIRIWASKYNITDFKKLIGVLKEGSLMGVSQGATDALKLYLSELSTEIAGITTDVFTTAFETWAISNQQEAMSLGAMDIIRKAGYRIGNLQGNLIGFDLVKPIKQVGDELARKTTPHPTIPPAKLPIAQPSAEYHAIVTRAYMDILKRNPDPDGLKTYVEHMERGMREQELRNVLLNSEEYKEKFVYPDIITKAYRDILKRDPDPGGLQHYINHMKKGMTEQQLRKILLDSPEYEGKISEIITRAYRDILKREPDPGGLQNYIEHMKRGMTEQQLRDTLLNSPEYKSKFERITPPPTQLVDDSLLRQQGRPEVYVIKGNRRYHIPNPDTFNILGYNWSQIKDVDGITMGSIPLGGTLPALRNGMLIRTTGRPEIHVIENNMKRHIPDPTTFEARFGKSAWTDGSIKDIPDWMLNSIRTGSPLPQMK